MVTKKTSSAGKQSFGDSPTSGRATTRATTTSNVGSGGGGAEAGEETLSYPVWVLRRAQEYAWSQGHARLSAKQMRQIRNLQTNHYQRTRKPGFFGDGLQWDNDASPEASIPGSNLASGHGSRNTTSPAVPSDHIHQGDSASGTSPSTTSDPNISNPSGLRTMTTDGLINWQNEIRPVDRYAKENIADLNTLQPSPGLANYGRGARRSRRDPTTFSGVLGRIFKAQGLESFLDEGRLRANWEEMVGPAVAKHAQIERIQGGQVTIRCDSTRWATQLRLMIPQIMKILDREAGTLAIESLLIKGPHGPSWKHGKRTVKGPGPRDTYG